MKGLKSLLLCALLAVACFTSCSTSQNESQSEAATADETTSSLSVTTEQAGDMFTERDLSGDYDESEAVSISLGENISIDGSGAAVEDSTITITEEGVYILSGELSDGNIIIDCADENAKVQLVLNNASISCSDYAPIYARNIDKLFITTASGTVNTIEDNGAYILSDDDSNVDGAIFSKGNITFNGSGELNINGTQAHAVVSKDNIRVTGSTLNINAVSDGLQGKDSVRICGGTVNINATEDAIKANNDEDEDEGFVYISGGDINIDAGDDGVHAETSLTITDGNIIINNSFEGLEGGTIDISGGTIYITSSDDGINSAGGSDSQSSEPFNPQNMGSSDYNLNISGGYILVNAGGDGLDSNGTLTISGGVILVSGPEDGMNGAIDYELSAEISGGNIIALGSSQMAEGFSSDSTQNSFMTNLTAAQSADTLIAVTDSDGNVILSFNSPKSFQNIVASSPEFELNCEYKLIVNPEIDSADENGYTDSGTASGGDEDSTITLTSVATNNGGGMGGASMGRGGMGGRM